MKFIDIFAGMGTIRMGFEQAGWECVYSVEWDKHKRKIYSVIFGEEPQGRDIREVRADELPRADCWCFGFPCQDISVAGKQLGFTGERSSLFFEVMRLLQETKEEDKPRYLFIENVKNLFSVNGGWDFFNLLYTLDEVGYDAEWQLINSCGWVPQNRERVYIIGHLRNGPSTRKVFPITKGNGFYNESNENKEKVYETALCLTAKGQSNWTGSFIKQVGNCMANGKRDNPNQGRVYDTSGISPTLSKMEGGGRQPYIIQAVLTPDRIEKKQNGRRIKEDGEPMFTLTGQDRHGVMITEATKQGYAEAYEGDSINLAMPNSKTRRGRVGKGIANTLDTSCNQGILVPQKSDTAIIEDFYKSREPREYTGNAPTLRADRQGLKVRENMRIRRLLPRECLRLQGISDEVTDKLIEAGISDTQIYRGAGDGCTVPVIYEIAKRL